MRHLKKGRKLGRTAAHKKALLASLAIALFKHGRITTTSAKSKELIPYAEKLISKAKEGTLYSRRQIFSAIRDKIITKKLFDEISPRFKERPGGYIRAIKKGPRHGDAAEMAVVELVE